MEGQSREEEGCHHQFLDFLPEKKDVEMGWILGQPQEADETKLELCLGLGPPGGEQGDRFRDNLCVQNTPLQQKQGMARFLHLQPVIEEPSQPFGNSLAAEKEGLQISDKKAFSAAPVKTALPQKRTASAQVVGWPPIRSSRKNLAGANSSKLPSGSAKVLPGNVPHEKTVQDCPKTLFVKINMEGVPIGRKVDLKALDSYEKLSYAVDELFRGLLAAQNDGSADGTKRGEKGGPLVNGSGEYTLVYEDNEGDRMLVGDVPWHMFLSTVKRLRVLRSSDLPALSRGSKLVRA